MEATAKYAYKAMSPSELSFEIGDKMKIIPYDEFWCRGRIKGKDGYVPKSYISIKPHLWFKGKITREESETLLLKKTSNKVKNQDGSFLIRHSENSPEDFSASVRYGDSVQHFKIFSRDDNFYIWSKGFENFNDLVDFYKTNSISKTQQIFLRDTEDEGRLYQALYDFQAEDDSELSMSKGDVVRITDTSDPNWWNAQNEKSGKSGVVPQSYLTEL